MYRRGFLGRLAATAAAGVAGLTPLRLQVKPLPRPGTGLKALLASGVRVGCCNVALTVYSAMVAQKMGMDAAAVKAEWVAGLLPGVQVVPSGVLAVARSQEKGCAYCFAG